MLRATLVDACIDPAIVSMFGFTSTPRTLWIVAAALLLALVGGVIAFSFMGGENKTERRLNRLYALDDPHFVRELGPGSPVAARIEKRL